MEGMTSTQQFLGFGLEGMTSSRWTVYHYREIETKIHKYINILSFDLPYWFRMHTVVIVDQWQTSTRLTNGSVAGNCSGAKNKSGPMQNQRLSTGRHESFSPMFLVLNLKSLYRCCSSCC